MKQVKEIDFNQLTIFIAHLSCGHKRRFATFRGAKNPALEGGMLVRRRACESNAQIARITEYENVELTTIWQVS